MTKSIYLLIITLNVNGIDILIKRYRVADWIKKTRSIYILFIRDSLQSFPGSLQGFPGGSEGKESTCNAGDLDSVPGEGNGYPLQYSCLKNSMNRGAWLATIHWVAKSQM